MKIGTNYFYLFASGILAISSISTSYAQENYQTEFSLYYDSFEDDDDNKIKLYGLTAEVYFSEVDATDHPYAEATFLERIGSVELLVGKSEIENGSIAEADGAQYGAKFTYTTPESPIAVQATYIKSKLEYDAPLDGDQEGDAYAFEVGYFLSDGLLASIGYRHSKIDLTIPTSSVADSIKYDDFKVDVKYVIKQPGSTALNIEGGLQVRQFDHDTDDGSNTIVGVSGDYYFNRKISLGGGLKTNTGDDEDNEGTTLAVNFKSFINPSYSITASVEKFVADNDDGEDSDSLFFGVSGRF